MEIKEYADLVDEYNLKYKKIVEKNNVIHTKVFESNDIIYKILYSMFSGRIASESFILNLEDGYQLRHGRKGLKIVSPRGKRLSIKYKESALNEIFTNPLMTRWVNDHMDDIYFDFILFKDAYNNEFKNTFANLPYIKEYPSLKEILFYRYGSLNNFITMGVRARTYRGGRLLLLYYTKDNDFIEVDDINNLMRCPDEIKVLIGILEDLHKELDNDMLLYKKWIDNIKRVMNNYVSAINI